MFHRQLLPFLIDAAARMPVVTLTGPRQSGKTTLVRHAFPDYRYVSLERPDQRAAAVEDPLGFLATLRGSAILDEVQRAPDLLSYIQVAVDEDPRPGRFILTGSQNLLLMERVSQTLAGRTALLELMPLSLAELSGRPALDPGTLDALTVAEAALPALEPWDALWRGFFPRIHDQGLDPTRWLSDYQRTYVERDLRDVLQVMDLAAFDRFLRLAAARTGQELNLSSLAADVGISQPTARQWLGALETGYLVTLLPPYHRSFRKRVRKRPKLHFLDTGLACHLLGIPSPAALEAHPLRGAIFESFVVGELTKAFVHAGRPAPLFHWRDATGHEVDVIVDLGTRQIPVEVKSGVTVASDAFAGLRFWTGIPGNTARGGVLVHGGSAFAVRDGYAVRPWFLG
jgi:hypothetical protein